MLDDTGVGMKQWRMISSVYGRLLGGLVIASAMCSTGCINTDPAVFVDAKIADAMIVATDSGVAVGISGGFSLSLHLSARASGTATVTASGFSILAADGTTTIHSPLGYTPSLPFPVSVAQDATVEVQIGFTNKQNQLASAALTSLCKPGGVIIQAVLDDSLRGGSFTTQTPNPVTVSGCP